MFLGWFRQVCSIYWTTIDTCCHVLYEIQDMHAVMRNCGSRAAGWLALVGLFVWLQHFCRHGSENISWDSQCKERSLSQAVLRERGSCTSCVMARGLLTLAGFKEAAGALQKVLAAWEGLDVLVGCCSIFCFFRSCVGALILERGLYIILALAFEAGFISAPDLAGIDSSSVQSSSS